MPVPTPPIVTCPQWGAKKPRKKPRVVRCADHALLHHTAGHVHHTPSSSGSGLGYAVAYARALQRYHMEANGWNDSGHSFLITRTGIILQGRWGTVSAIQHGRMVESAHCPSHNDAPGVEFEHVSGEDPTPEQVAAGVRLYAWIFDRCGIRATRLYGHRDFYATACPDNLYQLIPVWRGRIAKTLNEYGRGGAPSGGALRAPRAVRREIRRG